MDFDWTVKVTDLAIIGATLLSPFIAVQATEILRRRSANEDERRKVFHVLMSTRGARLAPNHVTALNRIDLAFPSKKYGDVSEAWGLYLRHLNTPHTPPNQEGFDAWYREQSRLLYAMLKQMAIAVGTPFADSVLQYNAYYPMGYDAAEARQMALQNAALEVLRGNVSLAIKAGDQERAPPAPATPTQPR